MSAIAANAYVPGFLKGVIYRGSSKSLCVPFLNCYSCPGALGACPVGSFQSLAASTSRQISLYVLGLVAAIGAASGRLVCGWLCPFGAAQDLLGRHASRRRLPAIVTGARYLVLALTVALPFLIVTPLGSEPYFCKYVCPAGTLEAGIPLAIANPGIRAALGLLFSWKAAVLAAFVIASLLVYRPFCRTTCPLGAFYGLFNGIALSRLEHRPEDCSTCGRCSAVCPVGIDVVRSPNSPDCIRCLECTRACPTGALKLRTPLPDSTAKPGEEDPRVRRLRVVLTVIIVATLLLIGWQAWFRPRTVGALPAAPAFTTTHYGKSDQAAFPGDYARQWIWLVFSGKD